MSRTISSIAIPADSRIARFLPDAGFHDCHALTIPPVQGSALALYLRTVSLTPGWINALMGLRNRLVSLVGLKNLGHLGDIDPYKPASAYRVGDRVGIFTLVHLSEEEVILGDSDRHLDVWVSFSKQLGSAGERLAVSTVVHLNNRLGRLYMRFVAPLHRRIVPASLRQLAADLK
ncbi:DUF2867 domain-containing protein [Pseudomonas sp. LRF_L74]|uniref:DUF2867 domain-containing protein n=1 Tax=Pseudomonas sp. LRF_L74 TaxID=3369422 RepID=UPI003F627BE1